MASITSLIQDDVLSSTLQKGFYALAVCSVIGTAAYLGYKAAHSDEKQILHHRHPESNEQVSESALVSTSH